MVHTHQGYKRYARERVREATAVYFEWLAQKEARDSDRRQRLSEVARFYRSLAGIIPAIPTQPIALPIQPVALRRGMIAWPRRQNKVGSLGRDRTAGGKRRLENKLPISCLPDTSKEQLVLGYRYHRPRTHPGVGG